MLKLRTDHCALNRGIISWNQHSVVGLVPSSFTFSFRSMIRDRGLVASADTMSPVGLEMWLTRNTIYRVVVYFNETYIKR